VKRPLQLCVRVAVSQVDQVVLGKWLVAETLVFDPLAGLVEKAGRGDRNAASALVHAVSPGLWRIAWRLLRDAGEAEDVVQEALIRMWKVTPNWKPGRAKIETWLYQVATNLCFDRLRKAGRFVEEAAAPEPTDPGPLPDADMVGTGLRLRIDTALAQLPDRQRTAIVLTHYESLPAKAAGEILGVSVDALESLLARARKTLRIALAEEKHELLEAAREGYVA
jgi:RNA polymerase sigma-70 factor, ECF subfamily